MAQKWQPGAASSNTQDGSFLSFLKGGFCSPKPVHGDGGILGQHQHQQSEKQWQQPHPPSQAQEGRQRHSDDLTDPMDTSGVEKELAGGLSAMSVMEGDKSITSAHDVAAPHDKSKEQQPMFLERCFENLDIELRKIPVKNRKWYDQAVFLSPQLYNHHYQLKHSAQDQQQQRQLSQHQGKRFVLNFLRSTNYDAKKATKKLVDYFQAKVDLFGAGSIGRHITLAKDFTEDERRHMEKGGCQPLRSKDRNGRVVWFITPMLDDWAKANIMFKTLFYVTEMLVETAEDFSLNGLVTVFHFIGPGRLYPTSFAQQIIKNSGIFLFRAMPCWDAANHACFTQLELKPLLYVMPKLTSTSGADSFQTHFGSHMECLYKLKQLGIPVEDFPVQGSGLEVQNAYWSGLLNERFHLEQKREKEWLDAALAQQGDGADPSSIIDTPTQQDVLLGRGKPYQDYPGNLLLAELIDSYTEQHKSARSNDAKHEIAETILRVFCEDGGRFLKRRRNGQVGWRRVSAAVALQKVKHGFRSKSKRTRQQYERQHKEQRYQKERRNTRHPTSDYYDDDMTSTATSNTYNGIGSVDLNGNDSNKKGKYGLEASTALQAPNLIAALCVARNSPPSSVIVPSQAEIADPRQTREANGRDSTTIKSQPPSMPDTAPPDQPLLHVPETESASNPFSLSSLFPRGFFKSRSRRQRERRQEERRQRRRKQHASEATDEKKEAPSMSRLFHFGSLHNSHTLR